MDKNILNIPQLIERNNTAWRAPLSVKPVPPCRSAPPAPCGLSILLAAVAD
ncbi:hypothetical protein KCP74_00970 [Salmonella enterica subsp. enterica]|nr:hypothetical protein KCP74_00970 [Salmonella enterica subsp. enterica]